MRNNGIVISGVFTYYPGVEYTEHDLIIYKNELYSVKNSFVGLTEELPVENCELYIKQHEYSDSNKGSNALITNNVFHQVLSQYFGGIKFDGTIETHEISYDDLDNFTGNGAYHISLVKCEEELFNTEFILRSYNVNEPNLKVLQELIATDGSVMILRKLTDTWSERTIVLNDHNGKLNQYISIARDRLREVVSKYNEALLNSFNFIKANIKRINVGTNIEYNVSIPKSAFDNNSLLTLNLNIVRTISNLTTTVEQYCANIVIDNVSDGSIILSDGSTLVYNLTDQGSACNILFQWNFKAKDGSYDIKQVYYSKAYNN